MGTRGPATRVAHSRGMRRLALLLVPTVAAVVAIGGVANAATATPSGLAVPGTPCTASARACVDLTAHRTWLIDGGQVVRGPVQMMDGDEDEPTPVGTFAVEWKTEQWTSRESGTPMPYSVFFAAGGVAFHEGRQDTPSAGCVKLDQAHARAWFDFLQVGDQVQVY